MYITNRIDDKLTEDFNWAAYFERTSKVPSDLELLKIIHSLRNDYAEDPLKMTMSMTIMMRKLLHNVQINQPDVIELGAATGFLCRWLLEEYGGKGTLVDNNPSSSSAFQEKVGDFYNELNIDYLLADVFTLEKRNQFDIACSFGLIEHFKDKSEIIKAHLKLIKPSGYIIILTPFDSLLSRIYWSIFPELNLGYRELLSKNELSTALVNAGLEVVNMAISNNYVYDFIGTICKVSEVHD